MGGTKPNTLVIIPTGKLLFTENYFVSHFAITDNDTEMQVFFYTLQVRKLRVKQGKLIAQFTRFKLTSDRSQ